MTAASNPSRPEGNVPSPAAAPADLKIQQELEALVHYIHSAKREIAALCPDEIRNKHIREATDELDAIVAHTEEATGAILDSAEKIEAIAGKLEVEPGMQIADAVTRIYEACNFQDITGQRIGKIVTALKTIETKIESLVNAFGAGQPGAAVAPRRPASDADLLRGPQLPGNAKTQDEIDALLKSGD
jgi:chemotaxis protein CheZ